MAHNTDRVDAYYSAIVKEGLVSSKVYARRHLEDLFKGIDFTNKRVLDIGGGSGVFSFCAGSMGAKEVVCMEPESKEDQDPFEEIIDLIKEEKGVEEVGRGTEGRGEGGISRGRETGRGPEGA